MVSGARGAFSTNRKPGLCYSEREDDSIQLFLTKIPRMKKKERELVGERQPLSPPQRTDATN